MQKNPLLTNRSYDALKFIALILLPALGALYFGLAGIWHLPNPDEVVGTVTVVDTFLGVILGLSSKAYGNSDAKYDGSIDVAMQNGVKTYTLGLNDNPESLDAKTEVVFKVNK